MHASHAHAHFPTQKGTLPPNVNMMQVSISPQPFTPVSIFSLFTFYKTCVSVFTFTENNVVCTCLPGYAGEKCDQCAEGFFGNPSIIGGTCRECNCHGNLDPNLVMETCDPITGEFLKTTWKHFFLDFLCHRTRMIYICAVCVSYHYRGWYRSIGRGVNCCSPDKLTSNPQ